MSFLHSKKVVIASAAEIFWGYAYRHLDMSRHLPALLSETFETLLRFDIFWQFWKPVCEALRVFQTESKFNMERQ